MNTALAGKPPFSAKKPDDLWIKLFDLGRIHSASIDHRQTGTDTAESFVTLTGGNGSLTIELDKISGILDYRFEYDSVVRLRGSERDKVAAWKSFETAHAADLAELKRLKEKLGLPQP